MDKEITEGQQQDNNDSLRCLNSLQGNLTTVQTSNNKTASPANSVVSRYSTRSQSQSRSIQLQLQRLEEEREFNMQQAQLYREYLNKKYQLLEEADDLCDISSVKSQSVRNWVKELPIQKQNNVTSADYALAATSNVANGSILNQAAYWNEKTVDTSNNTAERNPNSTNVISSKSTEMPQILNVCSYPAVSSATVTPNRMAAPICATNIVTNSSNQKQGQLLLTQSTSQQPATMSLPQHPAADTYHTSQIPNYNPNATFPKFSTILQPSSYDVPTTRTFTNNPISSTQYFNNTQLSESSINARQSVPKELPIFFGNPEDWPLFISTFEWSTAVCRLTHAENLIRLQKSIKGEALLSVQHMLVHPSSVPEVIEVLRMLYGHPEKILNSIKNRINLSPKVDENNLNTLTTFAVNVRSLIATINAANLPDEINNSFLLQQLVKKLPPSYQMQWATIKMQLIKENKKANLSAFDNWLFNIGLTASTISTESTPNKQTTINSSKFNINNSEPTINKRAGIYTHNERKCIICNSSDCKTVSECPKYQSLDRGEKWKVVRLKRLCKYCLCLHKRECKKRGVEKKIAITIIIHHYTVFHCWKVMLTKKCQINRFHKM